MSAAIDTGRPPAAPRHFLDLSLLDTPTLRHMLDTATRFKRAGRALGHPLAGRALALIFEKPSTRTRVSFEIGMRRLGGEVIMLSSREMQIGRGETVADTARVLSRYVDGIMLRTDREEKLRELAAHATVPVINGLTERSHPCQVMADVMTFEEQRGPIAGQRIAWIGDGNNMAKSWIEASARFGFQLRLACPEELLPDAEALAWARAQGADIQLTTSPAEAVEGARCVTTDTWVSMSDEDVESRHNILAPYRVDEALMARAAPDAIFMHCLPAHRGEEVSAGVIDGPQSVVFDEAENRLFAQQGILAWALGAA
ncbi:MULTISPECIES: ornithine carbamoyltransferase [Acidiphilium]|jgi:ornithine carbamoyltransferase|uniref:Ornithine carbamoyltransferase n=2 Tax=Acidiphilium TaxID=522 RepID=A5G1J9_ACICJ|nr:MULTISPECIES: ornithine carbamoyltransferase [Acidiphilium]MBU6357150.1 ornithine carbamoyltransferase [Rhodospirillales bacterium]ABQ31731.1 ornithine carbamoyltransferase [Acidiphilium cryptum JF-5]EGO95133.1 Ornithine carbamoyltransferase [Acidiphilium sp. PM]KDM67195.1 ornithine carbamoyltransferase ArgF [Acidiphilium sp. JA12-A1]MBS3023012.1 ornithine carbamoyltransferase [Acidiphilium multivorum]